MNSEKLPAKPAKGGAERENNTEYTGCYHDQPGNGAGDEREPGGGTGGGLQEDMQRADEGREKGPCRDGKRTD